MWHKGAAWPGCASVLIWNTCCLQCCVHSALRLWPYRFVLRPERQPETFIPWGYGHWPLATGHSQIHTPTRCSYMDSYMAFGMPGARCSMLLLDSFFFKFFGPLSPDAYLSVLLLPSDWEAAVDYVVVVCSDCCWFECWLLLAGWVRPSELLASISWMADPLGIGGKGAASG